MYSTRSGLTLAFHGCDKSLVTKILKGKTELLQSDNDYDWLGHGIYFWDYSPDRAMEYARNLKNNPYKSSKAKIKSPAVVGAVMNLGYCLDLLDYKNLKILKESYAILAASNEGSGSPLPKNLSTSRSDDLLIRKLDCAVIEMLHEINRRLGKPPYDSVRGIFTEGRPLYPNAGFNEKDHIQICIRNPNCIKGFFLPRKEDEAYTKV